MSLYDQDETPSLPALVGMLLATLAFALLIMLIAVLFVCGVVMWVAG